MTPKIKTVKRAILDGLDPKDIRCQYLPDMWPPKPPFLAGDDGFVECHLNALPSDIEEFLCLIEGKVTYRFTDGDLERLTSDISMDP